MEKHLKRIWDDDATDNRKLNLYAQCKDCIYSIGDDVWSNAYDKASCQKYDRYKRKPSEVMENTGDCPYRKTKETNKDEASNQPDHSEIKNTIDGLKKKYDL